MAGWMAAFQIRPAPRGAAFRIRPGPLRDRAGIPDRICLRHGGPVHGRPCGLSAVAPGCGHGLTGSVILSRLSFPAVCRARLRCRFLAVVSRCCFSMPRLRAGVLSLPGCRSRLSFSGCRSRLSIPAVVARLSLPAVASWLSLPGCRFPAVGPGCRSRLSDPGCHSRMMLFPAVASWLSSLMASAADASSCRDVRGGVGGRRAGHGSPGAAPGWQITSSSGRRRFRRAPWPSGRRPGRAGRRGRSHRWWRCHRWSWRPDSW